MKKEKITKKWFSQTVDKIFGYCDVCDTQDSHICAECGFEMSELQCHRSEGHCIDHDESNVFNFG